LSRLTVWLWKHIPMPVGARNVAVWALSPKFMVGVVGLVRDAEGRVLLVRHTYRGRSPWGLPGGGLQPDESLEECLRREIKEEAGLDVRVDRLLTAQAHYARRLVDMIFACYPKPGESLNSFKPSPEVSEARFFPPDDLPEGTSPGQRRLIRLALEVAAETIKRDTDK
jgi:8-oxo-dGTP diphosphatase